MIKKMSIILLRVMPSDWKIYLECREKILLRKGPSVIHDWILTAELYIVL
jgi:hypothetical protein